MPRVPLETVVLRPPTARSLGVDELPKFHVPFEALLASEVPPLYITVVTASVHELIEWGALRLRSIRQSSGNVSVASWVVASHIESNVSCTLGDVGVTSIAPMLPGDIIASRAYVIVLFKFIKIIIQV